MTKIIRDSRVFDRGSISRSGFMDYNDSATHTTALSYTTGSELQITNDGLGEFTLKAYKPCDVTELWNVATSQFDFTRLRLGDRVSLRIDINVTTSAPNQVIEFHLLFGIGDMPYTLGIYHGYFKTAATYNIVETEGFYIGNTTTKDYPGQLIFSSDDDATLVVNGFYIEVTCRE